MLGYSKKHIDQFTRFSFLLLALVFLSNTVSSTYFQACDIDPIELAEKCSEKASESESEELDVDEYFVELTAHATSLCPKKEVVDRRSLTAHSLAMDILTPPPEHG